MDNIWMNWSKPKYKDSEDFDFDYLDGEAEQEWFDEDSLMERRNDEKDALEDSNPDDLIDINIG